MPTLSFVPDACTALAIQSCIANKVCLMDALDVPSLSLGVTAGVDSAVNLEVSLSAPGTGVDVCLLAAVTLSFAEAGETLPTIPPPPAVPDMSASASAAADFSAEVTALIDPLGVLGGAITITFDGNGLPTLIEWDVP